MIFSIKEGFINTEGFEEVRYKEYTFYYSGILYLRGKKAGRESVLAVAKEYEATGVIPFIKIYGAFYLIISKPDGETIFFTDSIIIADEAAIGMINRKTTAVRIIPAPGKKKGDYVEFGGLLGRAPIIPVNPNLSHHFIQRKGRIPAPLQALNN
jgi:hypothetical protein